MALTIGSKVRFLNDIGGGTIISMIDSHTAEVQTDDGFEIPVPLTELLPDQNSTYDGVGSAEVRPIETPTPANLKPQIKPEAYRHQSFDGQAFLAIIPENERLLHVSDFLLYLVNNSTYSLQFQVAQTEGSVFELIKTGRIEADSKALIKKYSQTAIGKIKKLRIQGHFYKEGLYNPQPALDATHSLESLSFYKAAEFSENDYFNEKAVLFMKENLDMAEAVKNLSKNDLLKVKQVKDPKPVPVEKPLQSELIEVDLHIEEITESHAGLSNSEIIEIQLARFETALETAVRSNSKRIVFIHGVGNGILKLELRKKLDRKYPQLKYQDASFKEYGYGATMVSLK
ncbi:MAG: DUF2027 domain-containing protein [Bacteroidota bacterium]|nr:MAG: DUF2027 domain-containing protein [Bacteroidota bacterium]